MSQPQIEWVHLDPDGPGGPRVGDAVSAAAGGLPVYRVVALEQARAWVRDDDHAALRVVPLSRLHWKIASAVQN